MLLLKLPAFVDKLWSQDRVQGLWHQYLTLHLNNSLEVPLPITSTVQLESTDHFVYEGGII